METRIEWNNHLTVLWPTSTTSDSKKKKRIICCTLSNLLVIFNQNFIICSSSDMLTSLCWHLQGIAVQPIAFRSAFNSVRSARFSQFKQPMDKIKSLSTPFLPKLFANTSQYGSSQSRLLFHVNYKKQRQYKKMESRISKQEHLNFSRAHQFDIFVKICGLVRL